MEANERLRDDDKKVTKIRSVSEFVAYVETIQPAHQSMQNIGCFTLFRGQENKEWSILPSLYRQGLFQGEQLLIQYLHHSCPDEFTESRFDTLVKLQHFGLPTRLLDTTTNPLVALFFACYGDHQKQSDGIVYSFPNLPVMWANDPLIQLIMDYVFEYGSVKCNLSEMLNACVEKYSGSVSRLMPHNMSDLLHYLTIPAFAVMPEKTNKRILAQDGAFFLCGMKVASKEISSNPGNRGKEYYSFEPADLKDSKALWHKAGSVIIPFDSKDAILKQLDIMGINEAKLFPDLSHQTSHAVEYVKHNLAI